MMYKRAALKAIVVLGLIGILVVPASYAIAQTNPFLQIFAGRVGNPDVDPERDTVDVEGIVRIRPQTLMAGFDPTLIDFNDDSFDIIAVVRPSAVPLRTVTLTQNQGQFAFSMNMADTLPGGDVLFRATFNFARGTFGTQVLRALWGDQPGEFNLTAIDEAQQRHSFPDLEFGNMPAITQPVVAPRLADTSPGTKRVRPQVLAAGFNPTLIDLSDDHFDIMAIVREGAVPISSVTVSQNLGSFTFSLNQVGTLNNGDQLWKATFNFTRGDFGGSFRALWGDQPNEFNITVIDSAQQRHSFPDLEFGNNPAIN